MSACNCQYTDTNFYAAYNLLLKVFRRLQKLMVCLSHKATIRTIDFIGKNHDVSVVSWRDHLQKKIASDSDKVYVYCYSLYSY